MPPAEAGGHWSSPSLTLPVSATAVAMVAHRAAETWPEDEATVVQIVKVGSDHGEQSAEVARVTSLVVVEFDLRPFGFNQRPDLKTTFVVPC